MALSFSGWIKKVTKGLFKRKAHPIILIFSSEKLCDFAYLVANELTLLGADVVTLCRKEDFKNYGKNEFFDDVFCLNLTESGLVVKNKIATNDEFRVENF